MVITLEMKSDYENSVVSCRDTLQFNFSDYDTTTHESIITIRNFFSQFVDGLMLQEILHYAINSAGEKIIDEFVEYLDNEIECFKSENPNCESLEDAHPGAGHMLGYGQ